MFGKLLSGLGKAVGRFLGGPWGQVALTVAPMLFARRGGGGGQAGAAEQAAQAQAAEQQEAARRMMELANQIQIPPALAPTVFARMQAQALSAQPQLPAGITVPGLKELTQAKGMALAQQAGAQQQLADYDAQMRALAQRAQLISGAAGLAGGAGGAYQQLAQMYRQQQAGQLAGWAQLMPQIAQLFRKPQPTQLDVARSLGKFFRGW
jgi:hypothetical protein